MDYIKIEADGLTFEITGETTGDVVLKVGLGQLETFYLSQATAHMLGVVLLSIAVKKDPTS